MADDILTTPVEIPAPAEANVASLVTGIIGDFQALVAQQIRLTRQEIATNLRLRRAAATFVAAGMALGFLAATSLCLSLVHLLHWWVSPAGTDPAWLPLGACYAIVGAVLFVLSSGLVCLGQMKFRSAPPWQNLANELFQEKTPWTTNPK
jgi:hypothetical protein